MQAKFKVVDNGSGRLSFITWTVPVQSLKDPKRIDNDPQKKSLPQDLLWA